MPYRPIFNGSAVGVHGRIEWPEKRSIQVHASSLPVIGGTSELRIGPKRFGKHFSFTSLLTRAEGKLNGDGDRMTTVTTSLVEGVTIAKRLTVDAVEGSLRSVHEGDMPETSVVPLRTRITNLRLDGIPVRLVIDKTPFHTYDTKHKLESALQNDNGILDQFGKHLMTPRGAPIAGRQLEQWRGMIFGTVVKEIRTKHKGVRINGNVIRLEDYGTIYLGELLIEAGRRRLTMLRVELGSPVGGSLICTDVESNGGMIP
jgi:hypothetical protein